MKIRQLGDNKLEKKSKPVKNIKDKNIQDLIDNMLHICYGHEKSTGGLAAPQVGKNLRILIARRVDIEEKYKKLGKKISKYLDRKLWEVVINPKTLKKGRRKSTFWEGCLSVKKGKVFGPVKRSSFVKLEYSDRTGAKHILPAFDFFAHIILHEIDHLNGILFVKYIKNPENLWRDKALNEYIDKHDEFPDVKN